MKKFFIILTQMLPVLLLAQTRMQGDTLMAVKADSVTVISQKPFIQNLADKTVLNIEGRSITAGQNALEILKTAPSVVVTPDESIQMGGKSGVTVFIDGRNTQLSGQDLAQILKSIESDNIKEIELITHPSARFDASGNAGIINIKLKKSITQGINGSIAGSWSQSTHARQNGSLSLNARNRQWNVYSNLGINNGLQYTTVRNERHTAFRNYFQEGDEKDQFNGASARTGIDYALNKKNTIGVMWMYNTRFTGMDNRNQTLVQEAGFADTYVNARSIAPFHTRRNNWNLNYRFVSGTGAEFNLDADYTRFGSSLQNTVRVENKNLMQTGLDAQETENRAAISIGIRSIKADYTRTMGKNSKMDIGLKSVFTETDNLLDVHHFSGTNWVQDTGKTNLFTFTEQIHAAYLSVEKKWQQWQIQAGLRAEATNLLGNSVNLKNQQQVKPDTGYLNLFPTLFVQYTFGTDHQLGLTFSKRIDRPTYQDQNPFIYVLDAFNSEQGNPYLVPEISTGMELNYSFRQVHAIKVKYTVTDNYREFITYQLNDKTIGIPQNVGSRNMLSIGLSSSFSLNQKWQVYASAEPFYQQYNTILNGFGVYGKVLQNSWGFNGYMSNTLLFDNGWRAEFSGWFNFQNRTTIYQSKPFASINIGMSKKILSDKATVKISVSDLFNTQRWEQTAQTPNLKMHTHRKWESRNLTLGFSYRFGNNKIKTARTRNSGIEDETNRIK
jgi:iron complex outermembrane receptor protein